MPEHRVIDDQLPDRQHRPRPDQLPALRPSGVAHLLALRDSYQEAADALAALAGVLAEAQSHADGAAAAANAYEAAMDRCARALERVADVPAPSAASQFSAPRSKIESGAFEERFGKAGASPVEKPSSKDGHAVAKGASDGRAWQAAKANPTAPEALAVLLQTGAKLTAHRGDPDYFKAFADTAPDDVTAFQGLAAVDADFLNRFRLQEAVAQPDCPRAVLDLRAGLSESHGVGDRRPDLYILGFDTKGDGHVAVSFGNPDTAATITIYIPEPGKSSAGVCGDLVRVQAQHAEATRDPDGSHASVYWLGHPAPRRFQPAVPRAVGSDARRLPGAGGPQLAAFVNALNAQHHGPTNIVISPLGRA